MHSEAQIVSRRFAAYIRGHSPNMGTPICGLYRVNELTHDGRYVIASLVDPSDPRVKNLPPPELRIHLRPSDSNPRGIYAERIGFDGSFEPTLQICGNREDWIPVKQTPAVEKVCADYLLECLEDLESRLAAVA